VGAIGLLLSVQFLHGLLRSYLPAVVAPPFDAISHILFAEFFIKRVANPVGVYRFVIRVFPEAPVSTTLCWPHGPNQATRSISVGTGTVDDEMSVPVLSQVQVAREDRVCLA
jgi:hypothetical protein